MNSYSKALYELGKENNELDIFVNYAKIFSSLLKSDLTIFSFFNNINITEKDKEKVIKNLFKSKNNVFQNFIFLLIKERKFKNIIEIFDVFIKQYNNEKNILNGLVYTTKELKKETLKKIESSFSKKLGKKVYLENLIDKELIAGISVQIENKIWSNNIKENLKLLKNDLFNQVEESI